MHVAEVFSGIPGAYVSVADTVKGFGMILDGQLDHVSENDFYNKGSIEEVLESYEKNKGKGEKAPAEKADAPTDPAAAEAAAVVSETDKIVKAAEDAVKKADEAAEIKSED